MEDNKKNVLNNQPNNEEKKKKKGLGAWWNALPKAAKIAACAIAGVGVVSAVVFPTLAATVWNKGGKPVDPEPTPVKKWYEYDDWYNRTTEASTDDVGVLCKVKVNDLDHEVRLIGINHDEDDAGNTLHTTWEFNNLISDRDGYSLAYQWNDISSGTNKDYENSTIRYALTGVGGNGGKTGDKRTEVLVAQKGQTTWSNTYNQTILSMLPSGLQAALKTVKKTVGVGDDYTEKSYTDKLFMLSAIEMGNVNANDRGYGAPYSYYEGHTKWAEAIRIKKQVNCVEHYLTLKDIPTSEGQSSQSGVCSFAGYNFISDNTAGGYYWTRSPSIYNGYTDRAFDCGHQGGFATTNREVHKYAIGIAPAFCL